MALSQLQCLDDNHVNLRTNESKPEFFYSEEQRLALERLLEGGRELFEEFLKSSSARSFLSELEVVRLTGSVEAFCPDGSVRAGWEADEAQCSLQYWPERSDTSLPELDMGWPDSGAYRGVTRAHVYAQPPLEGDAHIKEVVRKSIAQAQKVIAVVMDLFTDVDIFQDLLDASFKRKVAIYIILESTGVPHFLKMCERAAMHTGHLKNLRVRSSRGAEFFTHSSKRVCGTQSQKFMFVDGDKALSGSYSFTWTASRLDRNIITMLTGQAVDAFDKLFRELYAMSNGVNLSMIKLDNEPMPEPAPQSAPTLLPSSTMALRLINPKYALVSSSATAKSNNIPPAPEPRFAKNGSVKQTKELSESVPVHPGLLHLEKANMIEYLPVWPEPDPPSDIIGFINIRDYNKPLQAHLMRSELFEVSQAIRFKEPLRVTEEPLFERASIQPKVVESTSYPLACELPNEQLISMQPQNSPEEYSRHARPLDPVHLPLNSSNEQNSGFLASSAVFHSVDKQTDYSLSQREEISAYCKKQYEDPQMSMKPQLESVRSSDSKPLLLQPKTMYTPTVNFETTLVKQSLHTPIEIPKYASNFSSTSDEYFECSDSLTVDSGFEGMLNGMLPDSGLSEQDWHPDDSSNTVTHSQSFVSLQLQQLPLVASSYACESACESLKEPIMEDPQHSSRLQKQCVGHYDATGMMFHWELDETEAKPEAGLEIQANRLCESLREPDKSQQPFGIQQQCDGESAPEIAFHWEPDITETGLVSQTEPLPKSSQQKIQKSDDSLMLSPNFKPLKANPLETNTDVQIAFEEKVESGHVEHLVVNNILGLKPIEGNESQLAENKLPSKSVLLAKASSPEYFECRDSYTVDSGFESMISGMPHDSRLSEQDWHSDDSSNNVTQFQPFVSLQLKPLALATRSYEHDSGLESPKAMDDPQCSSKLQEQSEVQHKATGIADQQQTQEIVDSSVLAAEIKLFKASPLEVSTDTQKPSKEKMVCLDKKSEDLPQQDLVVNDILNNVLKPVKANKSQLTKNELLYNSLLQAKASSPVIVVQTKTESQSILFSDRVKQVPHQLHSRFKDTSNPSPAIKVNDTKHARQQQKVATLRAVFERAERVQEKNCNLSPQATDHTDTEGLFIQEAVKVEGVCSFVPELKENAVEETVDIKDKTETQAQKALAGLRDTKHNTDAHSSTNKQKVSLEVLGRDEPVGEHTSTYLEHRRQPEAKPKLEGDVRKVHRPSLKPIRTLQESRTCPVKPSATKVHSSNHPTAPNRPATPTTGAQSYLHGKQLGQNRPAYALPTLPDKLLTRRSAPPRLSQSPFRLSRTDPSPGHLSSCPKQPQAQQDKTKTHPRQRSASTTNDSPLSSAALFLRRVRSLKRENEKVSPKEIQK